MNYNRLYIHLNNLLLDTQNARHGDVEDQNAVLRWMVSNKKSKIINLARSIATHGLNPSEMPIVIPESTEGLYRVLEGNRRVSVLKMLHDPEKCPDSRMRAQIRKIKQTARIDLPEELECVVLKDFADAVSWIRQRHLGIQDGVGIVPWGAKEKDYFEIRSGRRARYEAARQLLDYALENGLITKEQAANISITTLTRLIKTPDVRKELGLALEQGQLKIAADEEYVKRSIGNTLQALTSKKKGSVSNLKTKEQRVSFISNLKAEHAWGSYKPVSSPTPLPEESGTTAKRQSEVSAKAPKAKRVTKDSLSRSTPVSSGTVIKIKTKRLNRMFRELKSISVDDFPNAAAALTRVFIEGCVEVYLSENDIKTTHRDTLSAKVQKVIEDIRNKHPDKHQQIRNDLRGLQKFANEIEYFHAVIHNPKFEMTPRDLKLYWDNMEVSLPWFEGHI